MGVGKIRSLIGKLLRRKPKAPTLRPRKYSYGGGPGGHRGIAAGSLKPGKQDLSAENIAQWEMLSGQEADDFLYKGKVVRVHSSNVAYGQYLIDDQELILGFKNGSAYKYSNVSEEEANRFLQDSSKGGYVWSYLRVRGSRTAHKKPYQKIGGPERQPKRRELNKQELDRFFGGIGANETISKEEADEFFALFGQKP